MNVFWSESNGNDRECSGGQSILQLDGVTTYLKWIGRSTNDIAVHVLRSYKQRTQILAICVHTENGRLNL